MVGNFKRQHFGRLKSGLVSGGVWATIQCLVRQTAALAFISISAGSYVL